MTISDNCDIVVLLTENSVVQLNVFRLICFSQWTQLYYHDVCPQGMVVVRYTYILKFRFCQRSVQAQRQSQ